MEFADDAEKLEMINANLEICFALRTMASRLEECAKAVQTRPIERSALQTIGRAYELIAIRVMDGHETIQSIASLLGI